MKSFRFKQFEILQADGVFKVGTDGCLLAALADIETAQSVLDVGTGTGLIALMIAQRNPKAVITAIDINSQATDIAIQSFLRSPYSDRLSCIKSDFIHEYESERAFDVIVCNPPFFKNGILNHNKSKAIARHDMSGGVIQMIPKMTRLLNEQGAISLIIPFARVEEVLQEANRNGLNPSKRIDIRPFANRAANRTILTLERMCDVPHQLDFTLYSEQNVLSAEAKKVLQPFYSKL